MRGKFPAFYRWCRGPTQNQFARFRRIGYEVLAYRGFFGHEYYNRLPGVRWIHERLTDVLVRHPVPALTTLACVILRKPEAPR